MAINGLQEKQQQDITMVLLGCTVVFTSGHLGVHSSAKK
jgi:hypothetical protein